MLCGSGSSVSLSAAPTNPGNQYKWKLSTASGGGMLIKNVASNYVLGFNGSSFSLLSTPATGTTSYQYCRFGIVQLSAYIPMTSFSLSDNWLAIDTSKYLNIKAEPSNATWQSPSFFTWIVSDTSKITMSSTAPSLFTGVSNGKVTITVTNKLTGLSRSFTVHCGGVREGTYEIMNKESAKYINVQTSSATSGTLVYQWQYRTSGQEKWIVEQQSNGEYTLRNKYNNTYLGITSESSDAKAAQYSTDNGTTTRWIIDYTSSGAYKLKPKYTTTYCLAITSETTSNGANIIQSSYTDDTIYNDEWYFVRAEENPKIKGSAYYTVTNVNSGKALAVKNASTTSGASVVQNTIDNNAKNQLWKFVHIGNGEYMLQDVNSEKYLSVYGSSSLANADIKTSNNNGTSGLYFRLIENEDGTYSFLTKSSEYTKVIGIPNSSTTDGAQVKQLAQTNSSNIKFNLSADKVIVYICASGANEENQAAGSANGHVWLEFTNVSENNVAIGHYDLVEDEHISVGLFASLGLGNEGVWYNRESYEYHSNGKYNTVYRYSTIVDGSKIENASKYIIKKNNNYFFGGFNCVHFAINIWNDFDDITFAAHMTPQNFINAELIELEVTPTTSDIFYAQCLYKLINGELVAYNND
jgi:hypothetical protein